MDSAGVAYDTESGSETLHGSPVPEKLDANGYPLQPQPSDDPLDPLNWKPWVKLCVLLQVAILGLFNFTCQATQNPTFPLIADAYQVSITQASWSTTITILAAAISPLAWAPLSNVYGRRPVYIYVTIIGIVALVGSALATTWGSLLAARFFVGMGTSSAIGIGGSVVADLYYQHERGFYMGIYVVLIGNGSHIASLIGGPVGQFLGYKWCFWIAAIILGVVWLTVIFCLPETLYHRFTAFEMSQKLHPTSKLSLFSLRGVKRRRNLKMMDFLNCFVMMKYPPVYLSILYFSMATGFGSVIFAIAGPRAFGEIYGFDILQIGLVLSIPPIVGMLIGEILAGRLSDYLLLRYRRRTGKVVEETRLYASIPGAFCLLSGLIIEGVTLQYHTHWLGPCFGMSIGSIGYQVVTANIFGYLTDCYRPQSAEISSVLNFGRMLFSFTLGFYVVPFADATTWGISFAVLTLIHLATYSGIILLMWRGQHWRETAGSPSFNTLLSTHSRVSVPSLKHTKSESSDASTKSPI